MAQRNKKETKEVVFPNVVITLSEFNKRKTAWNNYYTKVLETKAYKRFMNQRLAFEDGDIFMVKRLASEALSDLENGYKELEEPKFSDPQIEIQYNRLGVKEWIEPTLKAEQKSLLEASLIFSEN